MQKLWNRNFTILTIGSFISALGSACAGIGFGILVYRETGSPLTLALFTVANIVLRMVTAFLAGPFVDRHSRAKTIYTLDFISATSFALDRGASCSSAISTSSSSRSSRPSSGSSTRSTSSPS
ncbi:MAG: hypothetical protein MZW92_12745 [Comamonadaceae bacterium]|nr:hypothetical protein [Comamonadaceae bacterium]